MKELDTPEAVRTIARVTLTISGMDCAEEVAILRTALSKLSGVDDLQFNLLEGELTALYRAELVSPRDILAAVGGTGMRAELSGTATARGAAAPKAREIGRAHV